MPSCFKNDVNRLLTKNQDGTHVTTLSVTFSCLSINTAAHATVLHFFWRQGIAGDQTFLLFQNLAQWVKQKILRQGVQQLLGPGRLTMFSIFPIICVLVSFNRRYFKSHLNFQLKILHNITRKKNPNRPLCALSSGLVFDSVGPDLGMNSSCELDCFLMGDWQDPKLAPDTNQTWVKNKRYNYSVSQFFDRP